MARTHAATWDGRWPVDPHLVDDLLTGIRRARADQAAEPPHGWRRRGIDPSFLTHLLL